jgi:hypothetical protein
MFVEVTSIFILRSHGTGVMHSLHASLCPTMSLVAFPNALGEMVRVLRRENILYAGRAF